jgi:hypothetical protein
MRKLTILSLGLAMLGAAIGLASVNAQDAPSAPKPPAAGQPGTMGGDMQGMMGMMGMMSRMNRMMDQCERMMQAQEKAPEKKDDSGKGNRG